MLVMAAGCALPGSARSTWDDGPFVSTAVLDDGQPKSLIRGTTIMLTVERRDSGPVLRWSADCNTAAAPVTINADTLDVGEIGRTAIGCAAPLEQQDEWLRQFFEADPTWSRTVGELTLTSARTVIVLERA